MGVIIKNRSHSAKRITIGFLTIACIGFSPIIIGLKGAYFWAMSTGEPCHEGNCPWGVLPWFMFFTIPLAFFLFIVFVIIIAIDLKRLRKHDNN